jgi:hypothetical protein
MPSATSASFLDGVVHVVDIPLTKTSRLHRKISLRLFCRTVNVFIAILLSTPTLTIDLL